MSLSATVLMGLVGALVMFVGARSILAHHMTLGDLMTFMALMAYMVAPMFQIVAIGTQLTEAIAGLERGVWHRCTAALNSSDIRRKRLSSGKIRREAAVGQVVRAEVWNRHYRINPRPVPYAL